LAKEANIIMCCLNTFQSPKDYIQRWSFKIMSPTDVIAMLVCVRTLWKLGMVVHFYNPSTREVEAGRLQVGGPPGLRVSSIPAWATEQDPISKKKKGEGGRLGHDSSGVVECLPRKQRLSSNPSTAKRINK
jgi:hypothetical protein